jgi:sulfite reductase alpha subunit-like flavoprotein
MMKVTILYGSAAGNAKQIAKRLASSVNNDQNKNNDAGGVFFRSAKVMEMNRFRRNRLFKMWLMPPLPDDDGPTMTTTTMTRRRKHALLIVCSTTGNGDAPKNASRFL